MIEVKNLTHIYNEGLPHESVAIDDVSITIDDGEIVSIIGHTGSGKSTMLQHLNGLLKPKSGTIIIDGIDITDSKTGMLEIRKKVGLVFQYPEYQLFEETVAKDVAFGPANLGLEPEEIDARVRRSVELVGLDYDEIKNASPFELSGGQKRRVAMAGVLAMEPRVLVLDEPTAGLNPRAHRDILDMVGEIHRREKNTIILVSHNMNDVARLSDRILVMSGGKLEMNGTPQEIFSREEEVKSMGLALPDSMEILSRLRKAGMRIEGTAMTIGEAADLIAESR